MGYVSANPIIKERLELSSKLWGIIDSFHANPKKAGHPDEIERLAYVCEKLAVNLRGQQNGGESDE